MKDKTNLILICFGGIVIIWFALLIAPYISGGIVEIISKLPQKMNEPFNIELCKDSGKTVFIFLCVYAMGIGIYLATRRNYRRGEEYGSAVWGNVKKVNKKYMQLPISENKILTQNVQIGLKAQKHRRNLNTLVCGGSRSRKDKIFC